MKHLLEALRESRTVTEFFEITRLIEQAAGGRPVRFEQTAGLTFPVGDVEAVRDDADAVRVAVAFLGLLGPASPLTPEWTEEILHADEEGALRAFYDVFVHRAVALLFSAWKVHAVEGGFDLAGDDALSKRLRSFAGVDAWADDEAAAVPPMAAVGLADYRRGQGHSIDVTSAGALLRRLLPAWNVRLEGGVRRFVPFAPTERARLGVSRCRLGQDLVFGDGCEETEGAVRVHIGPVDAPTYESLMPGGIEYERVERLASWVFSSQVDVDLEVSIASADAQPAKLGAPVGTRLGVDARYTTSGGPGLRVQVPLLRDPSRARRTFVVDP